MIPVFFCPEQVVHEDVGASPSAKKPLEVVQSWESLELPIEIVRPEPATLQDFCRAHDEEHVAAVLCSRKANGFGNKLATVAFSLPWTTGSLLTASRAVLSKKLPVAVSPTSGFHHAGYQTCEGFCTFNGLMVTVLALRQDGVGRIGILDCDEHYGNGTDDIIDTKGVKDVVHYTYGSEELRVGDGEAWLRHLSHAVAGFAGCEIVLYQAGADPHSDDPYGRGILSTEQLFRRDRIVFEGLKRLGVPVVWNLAGGYQKPIRKVLDIHDNTMRAAVSVFVGDL